MTKKITRITAWTVTTWKPADTYRALVRSAFPPDDLEMDMHYGELRTAGLYEIFDYTNEKGELKHCTLTKDYGLDPSSLVLDGNYHIYQLGRDHGCVHVNVYDKEVTVQRAAQLLLQIKAYLDAQGIPFHAIDFYLCEPQNADGQLVGNQISLFEVLYSDIYWECMLDRVQQYWNIVQEHHAIQDGEKVNAELTYLKELMIPEE